MEIKEKLNTLSGQQEALRGHHADAPGGSMLHVRIVGAGPVGQALAWLFQRSGWVRVSLADRINLRPFVTVSGLTVGLDTTTQDADVVVIACKAFDVAAAVTSCVASAPKLIMLCSNGDLAHLMATFRTKYPQIFWQRAIVTFGAKYGDDGIWLSDGGQIFFENADQVDPMIELWFALLRHLPRWQAVPAIQAVEREKWWLNTTLNTTLATSGLLFNRTALQEISLLQELGREAYALGIRLHGPWAKSFAELWAWLLQVIKDTGDNKNSTAYDVARGQRSEMGFLAGLALQFPGEFPRLQAAALLWER